MEMEDRLSGLPDDILCHILSFVPTHDAIATYLLSRRWRWRQLWQSVPALYFDDKGFIRNDRPLSTFASFTDTVLRLRMPYPSVTRFRLHYPCSYIQSWINIIIQQGVQHLYITVFFSFNVPTTVWTCTTLVLLELSGLRVPALGSVHLPFLKTLHLDALSIADNRYLADILGGSPILENLCLTRLVCRKHSDCVEFQIVPKLVKANICNYSSFLFSLNVVSNVVHLQLHLPFDQQDCFPLFFNLIHLELSFGSFIKWHLVFEMLDHCPRLQTFVLKQLTPSASSSPEIWDCPQIVPACIALRLRKCTLVYHKGCELLFAKYVMQKARALKTMTIHNLTMDHTHISNLWYNVELLKELVELFQYSNDSGCELFFK